MAQVQRSRVIGLYRQIMRLAKSWTSTSHQAEETLKESSYIREEAQLLFKRNKQEQCPDRIEEFIKEGETRISLAQHYGTPYPRLMNIPQHVLATHGNSSLKKAQRKALRQARPVYLKSYDDT